MQSQSFVRHAALYGVGNILVQAAGFFLLPFYTRYLTPSEYGTLEVLNRVGEGATIILLINGIRQAALAFYGHSDAETEKSGVASTTVALVIMISLFGGALGLVAAWPLNAFFDFGNVELLQLAIVAVILEAMTALMLVIPQARLESGFFVFVTLTQLLLRIGLSVMLVVAFHLGIWGILVAACFTNGLFTFALCVRELLRDGWRPNWPMLRSMVAFSLPFLPGGVCFFFLNNGDRFVLLQRAGEAEVGIYALGYKLALVVGMFTRTPLQMVWCAHMYGVAKTPDAPGVFGRAFTRILAAYLFAGLGLCLLEKEIIRCLAGNGYIDATKVIAPVVLAYFFLTAGDLMDAGFYVRRRTGLKTWITFASTALMSLLYILWIPPYGAIGAALATLGGFVFHAGLTRLVSQRVFTVHYEPARLLAMLVLAAGLYGIACLFPNYEWAIPIKAVLLGLWPTLLWVTGFVSPDEKQWIQSAITQGINNLRGIWSLPTGQHGVRQVPEIGLPAQGAAARP